MHFNLPFSNSPNKPKKKSPVKTSELVLACLLTLERHQVRNLLTIYGIHSFVSQLDPPCSSLKFVMRPIPYSVRLTKILDKLVSLQSLERFTIFDDGNHPQTVYRLTPSGRIFGENSVFALPPEADQVAEHAAYEAMVHDVDREVKLVHSLERALTA